MVSACSGGRFYFNAFLWPSERFDRTAFADLLFGWDKTPVAVNAPRQATEFDIHGEFQPDDAIQFNMKVGDNDLIHVKLLF